MAGIKVPVLGQLLPNGLEYGRSYLVEFESQSLWYETSLTITAHALRNRVKTEYHVLLHPPDEVREALRRLGCEARSFEEQGLLRILDTYRVTTGLAEPEKPKVGPDPYQTHSMNVSEWNKEVEREIRDGFPEDQRKWLHVDDDTSVVLQYTEEKALLDRWRTRWIPYTRARELADLPSLVRETASPAFYKQFETFGDGIFDFASREEAGQMEHYVRIRTLRGQSCDTRWHLLRLTANGEVKLGEEHEKRSELGIRGWLKGSTRT